MNLLDLLDGRDGQVGELARAVGIDASDAAKLVDAVQPALMRGVKRQAQDGAGLDAFRRALETGNHQRYVENPELLRSEETRRDGNAILGHLFGSKDVSRNVAAEAAGRTGLSADVIKQALPLVAGLAMGAMSKQSNAGRELGDAAGNGGLGPLAGLLDQGGDGGVMDDILGLAKRFF